MPHTDILHWWRGTGAISEDDFQVGLRVRHTYERSGLVGHATIVTSQRQGRCWTSRNGQQIEVVECHDALARMRIYLGEVGANLMIEVVGKGRALSEFDEDWAWIGGKDHVGRRVRHDLRYLDRAKHWGTSLEVIEADQSRMQALERQLKRYY